MKELAVLLTGDPLSSGCRNMAKVLDLFGVSSRPVTVEELLASSGSETEGAKKCMLLCAAKDLCALLERQKAGRDGIKFWHELVHSVFVYAGDDAGALRDLASKLTGDEGAQLTEIDHYQGGFSVSGELRKFCGVMAGVRIAPSKSGVQSMFELHCPTRSASNIISTDRGAVFLRVEYHGVECFLSTAREIIDVEAELLEGLFDIRNHVLSSLAIVLYVKWAFVGTCWNAPEANACLVIDDPVLKSTYGFIDFRDLLSLMTRHRFTTNVAFIPWNWRRSAADVTRLFREHPDKFSLSVHGCDHTQAEFGSPDRRCLYGKANEAVERMAQHESRTGIHHDPVMVFPQGAFSTAAMSVLKQTELIAAVNNDAVSFDANPIPVKMAELWNVAVMCYDNFPIFTRRYPWEGVENFAFDILLGKPCLISIHHDFCNAQCERLVHFIAELNSLNCPLHWRGLGEVVRRSLRQRELQPGTVEVETYAMEAWIENHSAHARRFIIKRRECSPSTIRKMCVGIQTVAWRPSDGYVRFECKIGPRERISTRSYFHASDEEGRWDGTLSYRVKTGLRRYLSEARDNYVMKYRIPIISRFARVN